MKGSGEAKKKKITEKACLYFCNPDVHHGEPSIYHGNQHTVEGDIEGQITLDMTQNKG